jgi:hypothetical protein
MKYSMYGGYGDAIVAAGNRAIAVEVKTPFAQRPAFVSASANMAFPAGGEFARVIIYTGEIQDIGALLLHSGNWEFLQSFGIGVSRLLATATFPVNGVAPFVMPLPPLAVPTFGSLPDETLGAALLLPCDKNLVPLAASYATFSFFGIPASSEDAPPYKVK